MNKLLIGSLALTILVPVTSATADEWERQKEEQQMMMEREEGMQSTSDMRQRENRTAVGRETRLDPASPRTVEDLENMPATAAGREDRKSMMDRTRQHPTRSGHRGEIESDY